MEGDRLSDKPSRLPVTGPSVFASGMAKGVIREKPEQLEVALEGIFGARIHYPLPPDDRPLGLLDCIIAN